MANREILMGKEVVDNNRPEDEDMRIGDDNSTQNNYYPAQQQGSTVGALAKMAIGAGLLATGVGAPVAGYLIADGLKNQPVPAPATAPAPAPVKDTDTDTQYEMFLDPPEETK